MTSRAKTRSLLARARWLNHKDGPIFLTIVGDPECVRLGLPMASNREAMIGEDHFEAAPDEPVESFHERMRNIAQERGARMVMLGHPENVRPQRRSIFALDG
jgi:hypothetical protein